MKRWCETAIGGLWKEATSPQFEMAKAQSHATALASATTLVLISDALSHDGWALLHIFAAQCHPGLHRPVVQFVHFPLRVRKPDMCVAVVQAPDLERFKPLL